MKSDFYTIQVSVEGDDDWLWVTFEHFSECMVASSSFYGLVLSSEEAAKKTIINYFSDMESIEYGQFMRKILGIRIVKVNLTATPIESL